MLQERLKQNQPEINENISKIIYKDGITKETVILLVSKLITETIAISRIYGKCNNSSKFVCNVFCSIPI